jgi:hypothetical protein
LPRARFEAMIRSGVITDDCTLAAYTLFLLNAESLRDLMAR